MNTVKPQKNDNKGEILIYKSKSGDIRLDVKLEDETVWLTQKQMSALFDKDVRTVNEHILNIFKEKELRKSSVIRNYRITASDGKKYKINVYNLDVIISVGYRVNSKQATKFRIWATNVLRNYLVRGYSLNQKRLIEQEAKLKDLKETISFISSKTAHPQLTGKTDDLLKLLNEYSNALTILHEYDDRSLVIAKKKIPTFILKLERVKEIVNEVRTRLIEKGEATDLFGREYSHKLKGIIGVLYQTFDKKELYRSVEEKAAHIFYLIIKDHPFSDGNKRLATIMFVYYLEKNGYLDKESGGRKIIDNTIVALSLLVALSDPGEKDMMIKIITNVLK